MGASNVGGASAPPDPRDAEIARLRARVAELEAGR